MGEQGTLTSEIYLRRGVTPILYGLLGLVLSACGAHRVTMDWASAPGPAQSPQVSDDGRTVTVSYVGGACTHDPAASAVETPRTVTIRVTLRRDSDPCPLTSVVEKLDVTLESPLGDRTLLDAETG